MTACENFGARTGLSSSDWQSEEADSRIACVLANWDGFFSWGTRTCQEFFPVSLVMRLDLIFTDFLEETLERLELTDDCFESTDILTELLLASLPVFDFLSLFETCAIDIVSVLVGSSLDLKFYLFGIISKDRSR